MWTGRPCRTVEQNHRPAVYTLTGQAKADYEAARVLLTDGDYAGARIKFQAAYDASKDPRLLWNVAASEKQLRHYAKAVELLKKYAAETSALVSAKERDEAKDLIKTLEPFTVAVTFEVNEAGADVEVDDTSFGKTPLAAPLVIDIGQHKVRVHKDGFRDYAASASIGGSPQQTIAVKLEKEVHQGTLSIAVPAGATVFVDGQPVPVRPNEAIELKLASGGHTVRVTAPGMRAYQSEVVVRDNEARAVSISASPSSRTGSAAAGAIRTMASPRRRPRSEEQRALTRQHRDEAHSLISAVSCSAPSSTRGTSCTSSRPSSGCRY